MVLACVSLLASQTSGLHMHVDADGYAGTPQGTHVHGQGIHRHGGETHANHGDETHADHGAAHEHPNGDQSHDGDKDVSITELSTATSKLGILPVWMGVSLLIPVTLDEKLSPYSAVPRPVARHEHWRPPLRAPPRLS